MSHEHRPLGHSRHLRPAFFPGPLPLPAILLALSLAAAAAADKNGVSPTAISLPSGPGSVEGLGDSFQPALNSGTMRYELPLTLPPGPAGHTPVLQLSYEGGLGNGPLGFGWNLPLPFVQRQTDHGIPRYVDAANGLDDDHDGQVDEPDELDRFVNDAKEELVPVAGGNYFCKNEGAFIRYRRIDTHWEGTRPDGTKMEFGLTPAGRLSDPANPDHVFKWLLERETDTHGNTIVFTWHSFPGAANLGQAYLQEIRYGPGAPPWPSFHFAAFAYEDRLDWFEDGRAGFLVRTGKRLREITIGTQGATPAAHAAGDFNADGLPDVLNRRYRLAYLDTAPGQSPWSLLHEITQVGADDASTLPPARFEYALCQPPPILSAAGQLLGGTNEPTFTVDNANVELADLNGDGLPDLLRTGAAGGVHLAYLNRGEKTNGSGRVIAWSAAQPLTSADGLAWNITLQSTLDVASLSDMDGDGLADLAYKSALGDVFFFANQANLGWGTRQFMSPQDTSPPAPFGNANARSADLDFDKRMDIIESISTGNGADYRIWFNLGQGRYARSVTVPQSQGFLFSLSGVQVADFNGDRVPDLLRIQASTITFTAGLGYGNFAPAVVVPLPDTTLDSTQIAKARLVDINHDGLVDLVLERAAPGQIWYWLNQGNASLAARRIISGLPGGLSTTTRWADLNGDGVTDLIYADSAGAPKMLTVDLGALLGCVPAPNTLTRLENGLGRVIRIEYAPSTRFALDDAAAGQPWTNSLPFPVAVVARVLTDDSLGHTYETRFRYHQGYYDATEKEFRGFACAEQIEVGEPSAPTLVSRSFFDTGIQFESMKGKRLRLITEQETGEVFWEESTSWALPPPVLYPGTNGHAVTFVHQTGSTKTVKELGQGTERTVETELAFDAYGNQTLEANYGIVEPGSRSAFDDERIITNEFALNLTAWIVRCPRRTAVLDEHGAVISRVDYFYDDETFSGNNPGQVQAGNLTLRREWIDPARPDAVVAAARTRYDAYGNPLTQLDPLASAPGGTPDPSVGHYREVTYDEALHTYATAETVRLEGGKTPLVMRADYDPGFGKLTAARDYSNQETRYGYDAFGRLQQIVRPGDTADYPTTEYEYVLAQPAGPGRRVNYVETRALDKVPGTAAARRDHYLISRRFTDGLGRCLMTRQEAEPAPGQSAPRVILQSAAVFNARQKPSALLQPCFTTVTGSLEQQLAYEDVTAPGWQGLFHQDGQLVALDFASAHKTTPRYDATLREIARTNADGTFTRNVFEPFLERRYDENDNTPGSPHEDTPLVAYQDGLGRQIRTDEIVRLNDDGTPSGALNTWTTTYAFDLNDQLVRITDAQANVKEMAFDGLRRLVWVNDPDRGGSTNLYDEASNRIETRDAKGQRITYTYDGANRLLTEDYHDEDRPFSGGFHYDPALPLSPANRPDVAYFYDAPVANLDFGDGTRGMARNTEGLLAYVWDLSGEEHRSYDARHRLAWTVKRIRDPRHGQLVSYRTQEEHDSLDRLVQLTFPDNDAISYHYNERNRPSQITGDQAGDILAGIDYLPSGQIGVTQYGNGVRSTCRYDARARLVGLVTAPDSAPGGPYAAFAYTFDGASNLEAIRDQRPADSIPAGDPRRNTQRFAYDDLNRLTQVRYSFGVPGADEASQGQIDYRYDRIGNLIAQTSDLVHLEQGRSLTDLGPIRYGGEAGSSGRLGRPTADPGPHAPSQVGTAPNPCLYDPDGNLVQKDGATLTFDFRDRLVSVEDATLRADYTYDFQHRRIIKQVTPKSGADTNVVPATGPDLTFYVSAWFEVRPPEAPVKYIWNGPTRVARVSGSLSANPRTQRLRLVAGWNLVALAVSVVDLPSRWTTGGGTNAERPVIESAFRWDAAAQTMVAVAPGENEPAGAVLWLKASAPGTLCLTGSFVEPPSPPSVNQPGFVAWPTFDPVPISGPAWLYNPETQGWLSRLPAPLAASETMPAYLAPGRAVFLTPASPSALVVPDASLRLRYYHADHLGSASVMTDQTGQLVQETAYYPFGLVRHAHEPRAIHDPYAFSQKERDPESGLHYFEARYLAGVAGRFISVDPAFIEPQQRGGERFQELLDHPQQLNLYAYAHNNPLAYTDPTGYDPDAGAQDTQPQHSQLPTGSLLPWKGTTSTKITVLAGHGIWAKPEDIGLEKGELVYTGKDFKDPGYLIVPEGTTITFYAQHTQTISQELGAKVETRHLNPKQYRVTYYPGDKIPNYTLVQPHKLAVHPTPGVELVTVSKPTSLKELLKPGMGAVHWAACRQTLTQEHTMVDDLDYHSAPPRK